MASGVIHHEYGAGLVIGASVARNFPRSFRSTFSLRNVDGRFRLLESGYG